MKQTIAAVLLYAGMLTGCAQSNDLELEGGLYMKGYDHYNRYLLIEDRKSHRGYKINNPEAFHLEKRQKEIVKLKARLVKKAIGPGFPAEIEVVAVEN